MPKFIATKLSRARKYFIISVILLPILFLYATPVPGFTVGDAFMLLSWLFLMGQVRKNRYSRPLLVLLLYVFSLTIFCWSNGMLERPTTSLRYIVYLLVMAYLPTVSENREYAYKVLNVVGLVVMTILYIQWIALNTMGVVVPGLLTFLPLTDSSLQDYNEGFNIAGRVMSVFAEPSHYAVFIVLFIVYRLFLYKGLNFKRLIIPLLASLSVILCSSFTGMIGMAAVWGVKLFFEMRKGKISISLFLSIIAAFALLFYVATKTSVGAYVTDIDIYERQSLQRFGGYEYILKAMGKSGFALLFGNGMNDIGEIEYLPGWPRLIYYYGIVGGLLYIITFCKCAKWNTFSIVLLIVIAGLMIGTEMNFGPFVMPYTLLVVSSTNKLFIEDNGKK